LELEFIPQQAYIYALEFIPELEFIPQQAYINALEIIPELEFIPGLELISQLDYVLFLWQSCGRSFAEERIDKHEEICFKVLTNIHIFFRNFSTCQHCVQKHSIHCKNDF
jgi:hypothetical protein